MALRTASQTGNLKSVPYACGTAFADGDTLVWGSSAHTVTVDADTVFGVSPPQCITTVPTVVATGGGASGGFLAAGTYRVSVINVDSNGLESSDVAVSATFTVIAGNIPRVTLPALASGVSSRKLALSDTNSPTGARKIYLTGNTTTTADLSSASWTDGTTTFAAAAAPTNPLTLVITGPLVIKAKADIRGDWQRGNVAVTLDGSGGDMVAGIEFNAANAASPSNARYAGFLGTASTQTSGLITTANTSASARVYIRSNAGGANGYFRTGFGVGAVGPFSDSDWFSPTWCVFTRIGDSVNRAFSFLPSTSALVQQFTRCIFDSCARMHWASNAPAGGGWNIQYCTWRNSVSGTDNLLVAATATLTTGTRSATNNVFDKTPSLTAKDSSHSGNIFDAFFAVTGGVALWTAFDANLVFTDFSAGSFSCSGDFTNNIVIGDTSPSASVSGTATGATSTTLVDSTKSWTTNQFAAAGVGAGAGWCVTKQSGGVWESRIIASNTATTLTVNRAWDTTPTAGDTYKIYGGVANAHFVGFPSVPASSTVNITDNIGQLVGSDNNGDFFLHLDSANCTYNLLRNIILPSVSRDCSGTLLTSGTQNINQTFVIEHNTYFTGGQCLALNEGAAEKTATGGSTTTVVLGTNPGWLAGEIIKFSPTTATVALRNVVATISSITGGTTANVPSLPAACAAGDVFVFSQPAGRVTSLKSNIPWAEPGKTYVLGGAGGASTIGPFVITSTATYFNTSPTHDTQDLVTAGANDYNSTYGLRTDGAGGAYNVNQSAPGGTHDISADPQFVDRWRSFWSWGWSLGLSGDPFDVTTQTRAKMRAINDPNDANYDSRFTFAALQTYLRDGQRPQNSVCKNAGHDGVTIGALEGDFTRIGDTSVALGAVTSSATGAVAIQGNLSTNLGATTVSAAAALAISADLSAALGGVTLGSTGGLTTHAGASITLGAVTLSASGGAPVTIADASITLGAVTLASAGALAIQGDGAIALGAVSLTSSAGSTKTGGASITLGAATLASTIVAGVRVRTVGFSWNQPARTFSWSA